DGTGDPNRYVKALQIMADPTKRPVLVHCATGAQRTGGCGALFPVVVQGKGVDAASEEAKDYKQRPRRDTHLRPYLEKWVEPIGKAFRIGGVIPYDAQKDAGGPSAAPDE